MVSASRRSESLRDSTRELLQAGQQPHIEFKSAVVIGAVAKQVAAGANFVAFQPAVVAHTIVYGATGGGLERQRSDYRLDCQSHLGAG